MIPELDDQDKYPHEFVTTFAPIPAWEDAEPGTTYTESHFYSISKTSKHPQEAYEASDWQHCDLSVEELITVVHVHRLKDRKIV